MEMINHCLRCRYEYVDKLEFQMTETGVNFIYQPKEKTYLKDKLANNNQVW